MKTIVSLIFVFVFSSLTLGEQINMDMDTLLAISESTQNGLNDITIQYEFEVNEPNIVNAKEQIKSKGGSFVKGHESINLSLAKPFKENYKINKKFAVEDAKGNISNVETINSYDGETVKTCQFEQNSTLSQDGTISNKPNIHLNQTPLGFTAFYEEPDNKGIPQFIRFARDTNKARFKLNLETVKINDFNTVNLELWRLPIGTINKEILLRRYAFSVDHNYTLVRIEITNGREVIKTFDVLKLTKLENGIWFPSEGKVIAVDGLTNNFKITKVTVNQGLMKKDFNIVFPSGTKVVDEISGKQYMIKPTQEQVDQTLSPSK